MSYKWQTIVWTIIPVFASTYGSGAFNTGNYNGAADRTALAGGAAPAINIGPISLPVTGATMAVTGMVLIAAAAALIVWVVQSRRAKS